MSESHFYYEHGGQAVGPVTFAQLKALAASKKLKPGELVWREGMANWAPARSVPDLFPPAATATSAAATAGAPPLPDTGKFTTANPSSATASGDEWSQEAMAKAKHGWSDALVALRILYADPLGGIANVYETLGPDRAMIVGGIFGIAFLVCGLLGSILGGSSIAGLRADTGFAASAQVAMIRLVADIAMAAAMLGISSLYRQRTRSRATFAGDVLLVGTALVPVGAGLLLARLFVGSNAFLAMLETIFQVAGFGLATILIFGGLTRLIEMSQRLAAVAAPGMIAIGAGAAMLIRRLL